MKDKRLTGQGDTSNNGNFASMLAEEEKKMVKKTASKDIQPEQDQTSMQKMNTYNHNAKEIYFYKEMATTDLKC